MSKALYFDPVAYHFCFRSLEHTPDYSNMQTITNEIFREFMPFVLMWHQFQEKEDITADFSFPQIGHAYVLGGKHGWPLESWLHKVSICLQRTDYTRAGISQYMDKQLPNTFFKEADGDIEHYWKVSQRAIRTVCNGKASIDILTPFVSCYNEDLDQIYLPKRLMHNGMLMCYIGYVQINKRVEIISDADKRILFPSGQNDIYQFTIDIRIPRMLLRACQMSFTLQESWMNRMEALCCSRSNAFGLLKMDLAENLSRTSLSFESAYSHDIPCYAWALYLNPMQAEKIRKECDNKSLQNFHKVKSLNNGGMCLQLTPDIQKISRIENDDTGKILQSFMRTPTRKKREEVFFSLRIPSNACNMEVENNQLYYAF